MYDIESREYWYRGLRGPCITSCDTLAQARRMADNLQALADERGNTGARVYAVIGMDGRAVYTTQIKRARLRPIILK